MAMKRERGGSILVHRGPNIAGVDFDFMESSASRG
jgi:hypothetical protein